MPDREGDGGVDDRQAGSSPDQLGYYEQQVAQGLEDYLSGRCGAGALDRRWVRRRHDLGRGRSRWFMRAMAGCDPRPVSACGQTMAARRLRRSTLRFSAPKSVSVLFAMADEYTSAALLAAHEGAVEAAFG
jgi:TrwC relaxase